MNNINKEAFQISKYINDFLNVYCPESKTVSNHTIKSYRESLKLYLDFLETKKELSFYQLKYDCFKASNIEEWLVYLMNERNCKPQTANVRLSSLKAFLDYMRIQDISLNYLMIEAMLIKKRKAPKIKVKGMSQEAVKKIASAIDQTTKSGIRDIALFAVFYDTAIRVGELLSLKMRNVHLDTKHPNITVIGKGNKTRCLGLQPKTVKYLKKYISKYHGESSNENNYLFYSKIKGKEEMMSQPAVSKQLKKWAKLAHEDCPEVPIALHPHQIRHAAATHWLDSGINIGEIQYLLGHENIQTTMIYLEITITQKTRATEELMTDGEKNQEKLWKSDIKKLRDLCN